MISKSFPHLLLLSCSILAAAEPSADLNPPAAFKERPRNWKSDPAYSLSLAVDLPILAGALALNRHSGSMLKDVRSNPIDLAALDRGSVPGFDRWAIGFHSSTLSNVSSGLAWSEFAIPLALNSWEILRGERPWHGAFTDALILQEALMISSALSNYAKSFPLHSTPLTYDSRVSMEERQLPQNVSSFFSNHTSTAFTIATFTGYTYQLRHPGSPLVPWVWGTSMAMAAGVGSLRVLAGKHFPSDVLMGAAVGTLCGYFVPRMHLRTRPARKSGQAAGGRTDETRIAKREGGVDVQLGVGFPAGSQVPGPTVNIAF